MSQRKPLDLGRLGADNFQPKPTPSAPREKAQRVVSAPSFPSREAGDSQMNIKGPEELLNRFRQIVKRDGLRASGLLQRALDAYEREQSREGESR
jgi:hypothetical protein